MIGMTVEVNEDVTEAMWLGLSPEEEARMETEVQADRQHQASLDEWEAYTLRQIEEYLEEMEEGDEADNYFLA